MSLIESVLQNRWISCGLMNLHLHYLHDLKNHWLPKRNDWIKSQFQMTISVVLFLMPWFWEPHCHLGKAASFMWLHVGKGFKCSILIYFTSFLPVGFVRFPFMAGFLFVHYYAICFNIYIYRHRSLICLYIYICTCTLSFLEFYHTCAGFFASTGAPHLCCFHGSALFSGLQFSSPGAGGTATGKMEGFRAHQDGMGQTDCPWDICIFFQ